MNKAREDGKMMKGKTKQAQRRIIKLRKRKESEGEVEKGGNNGRKPRGIYKKTEE